MQKKLPIRLRLWNYMVLITQEIWLYVSQECFCQLPSVCETARRPLLKIIRQRNIINKAIELVSS